MTFHSIEILFNKFYFSEHCEKNTTKVSTPKDGSKIEKLSPTTSKTLHSLMVGHFTTDSTTNDDNEEDASIKWRDSRSLSDYTSEQGRFWFEIFQNSHSEYYRY